jgi:hypothetical protein
MGIKYHKFSQDYVLRQTDVAWILRCTSILNQYYGAYLYSGTPLARPVSHIPLSLLPQCPVVFFVGN